MRPPLPGRHIFAFPSSLPPCLLRLFRPPSPCFFRSQRTPCWSHAARPADVPVGLAVVRPMVPTGGGGPASYGLQFYNDWFIFMFSGGHLLTPMVGSVGVPVDSGGCTSCLSPSSGRRPCASPPERAVLRSTGLLNILLFLGTMHARGPLQAEGQVHLSLLRHGALPCPCPYKQYPPTCAHESTPLCPPGLSR